MNIAIGPDNLSNHPKLPNTVELFGPSHGQAKFVNLLAGKEQILRKGYKCITITCRLAQRFSKHGRREGTLNFREQPTAYNACWHTEFSEKCKAGMYRGIVDNHGMS